MLKDKEVGLARAGGTRLRLTKCTISFSSFLCLSERGGEAGNPKGGGKIWPCRLAVLGLAASVLGRVPSASVLGLAGSGFSASVVGLVVLVVNLAGLLAFSSGFGCECGAGATKVRNNSLQLCLHHIGNKPQKIIKHPKKRSALWDYLMLICAASAPRPCENLPA